MYIKITPECEAFEKLKAIEARFEECHQARTDLAKRLGFVEYYVGDGPDTYYGGISAFSTKEKPANYKFRWPGRSKDAFWPKETKENEALIEEIENLPTIGWKEICDATGYEHLQTLGPGPNHGTRISYGPGIEFDSDTTDYFLMYVKDEATYELMPGMIEITSSEYKSLKKDRSK